MCLNVIFLSQSKLGVVITILPINCPVINLFVNKMANCDHVVVVLCVVGVDLGFESTFVHQTVQSFVCEESHHIVPSSVIQPCISCTLPQNSQLSPYVNRTQCLGKSYILIILSPLLRDNSRHAMLPGPLQTWSRLVTPSSLLLNLCVSVGVYSLCVLDIVCIIESLLRCLVIIVV